MRRLCIILLTLSTILLTACGGDSSPPKAPPGSADNPLPALPNPESTRVPPASEAGAASKASGTKSPTRARSVVAAQKRTQARNERARAKAKDTATGGEANGASPTASRGPRKQKALAPSAKHPCSLVTKAQARAIIGAPILEPLEAPQGPTCIYESRTGKRFITLTVQRTDFARLEAQVRKRRDASVSNRRALCGSYGRPMLYVSLAAGRVLSVAGPCDLATRFAAKAVPHL